jgi:tRNA (cmo5U34)-methyltransferase
VADDQHDREQPAPTHPAAHWSDPQRVQEYRARVAANPNERRDQLELLARLIPFTPETPLRVLDLGAGFGLATAVVLDAFPAATATLVEMSPPMIESGAEWLAPYAGRYEYVRADFVDGQLPETLAGPFHAAISSLALQYVPAEGKRRLFEEVIRRLAPGGCLLSLHLVGAPDERLQEAYTRAAELERTARGEAPWRGEPGGRRWQPQSVEEHLDMLRAAGFAHVDCFWKRLGTALIGAYQDA